MFHYIKTFIAECHRRRVFRIAALYVIAAWVVLQVSDLAFDSWGVPQEALRHVWFAAIVGFPIALVLGWRFDIADGRIRRTGDRSDNIDASLQRVDYIILGVAAVVAIAITAGAVGEISREPSSLSDQRQDAEIDPRSIAVLPFEDMSASQDQEYFGDGIAEELLNRLARVQDFRVAGRTSSFAFKGRHDDLRLIGDKLNVAAVLEGSVRKDGSQLRITAQLINTADGFQLWSETYDREMDNVFAIQDEIARSVVLALQSTLLEPVQPADLRPEATTDSEAYVLYLRGRHLVYKRSADSSDRAQALFEQAIEIDPDYAPAYAGLGMSLVLGPNDLDAEAEAAIRRALELEPGNSEALTALGLLRQIQGRPEESRKALTKAIASNPNNANAHTWLGRSYADLDPTIYLAHVRKAYRTDPLDATTLFHLSVASSRSGQYEAALAAARERRDLDPSDFTGYLLAGNAHHARGNADKALKSFYDGILMNRALKFPVERELIAMQANELAVGWEVERRKESPERRSLAGAVLAFLGGQPEEAMRLWSHDPWAVATKHIIFGGDFKIARESMEKILLQPGGIVARYDPEKWPEFMDYALTLQHTGEPERAAEMIGEISTLIESQLASGVVVAPYTMMQLRVTFSALLAMNGDTQRAMVELQRAADQDGVLWCTWCLRHWPHWDNLRDDPDLEVLISEQEAILADQRRRLADEGMLLTPQQVLELEDFDFDPFVK